MKKKKTNPRHIPKTDADVRKAYEQGYEKAMQGALILILYVLSDKYNASTDDLQKFNNDFRHACECVNEGYAKLEDFVHLLVDEYDVNIDWI